MTFVVKFLSEINFVAPIKAQRVKSNTKPWFNIDFLNAIWNREKYYKNSKDHARKLTRAIFSVQTRKYFTLKKKLQKIRIILKTLGNFKLSMYAF